MYEVRNAKWNNRYIKPKVSVGVSGSVKRISRFARHSATAINLCIEAGRYTVATDLVPKQELVAEIRQIVASQNSGVVSIVTDAQRSIVLRFLDGKLTHCNARGKGINGALDLLSQSTSLRFNFVAARGESRGELMPAGEFASLIEAGSTETSGAAAVAATASPPPAEMTTDSSLSDSEKQLARETLTELSAEYIGPMAGMLVEQAIETGTSFESIINEIARTIPIDNDADEFRKRALVRIKKG